MANWKYYTRCCELCGTENKIRADVHRKLERESRDYVCKPCRSSQHLRKISTKHGYYGTPTYRSWIKMKDRCLNENHKYYHLYGGRGITVDEKWLEFAGFLEDMGEMPMVGYSLDRIDNDVGYTASNCRWIPRNDQQKNRRNCKKPYVPEVVTPCL